MSRAWAARHVTSRRSACPGVMTEKTRIRVSPRTLGVWAAERQHRHKSRFQGSLTPWRHRENRACVILSCQFPKDHSSILLPPRLLGADRDAYRDDRKSAWQRGRCRCGAVTRAARRTRTVHATGSSSPRRCLEPRRPPSTGSRCHVEPSPPAPPAIPTSGAPARASTLLPIPVALSTTSTCSPASRRRS